MKIILLSQLKDRLAKVYAPNLVDELRKYDGFSDVIYDKEMIMADTEAFKDVEYIFSTWGMPKFIEEEIKSIFPKLKCVFYGAGTVQLFARPFLNCGVRIFSAWAANAIPVAEYTAAQIILSNKGFYTAARIVKNGGWDESLAAIDQYLGNYNVKVGIIGTGMIGKATIRLLKPYNIEILAYSQLLTDENAAKLGVTRASVETIFEECTVISNHLADNEHTKNYFTYDLFSKMKNYTTFINTGRGAQVVEEDLIRILKENPTITAILDVSNPEPPVAGSEFYSLDNCILSPHMAGSKGNEVQRMAEYMIKEFNLYLNNEPCEYEVTMDMLEKMA